MKNEWGTVDLYRSDSGMPLLAAESKPAAYFGLGYAQAADDILGLLRQYLLARAELSILDRPEAAERDANQKRWQVLEESRLALDALPTSQRECYSAFVAGVAAWMSEHEERVPNWAPQLEPALPIAVNRTVTLYWVIADAVQALRNEGIRLPAVVSELDRTPMIPGSNAWVLLPRRTSAGETFVVSDPHLPFGGVHAMHEATVSAGDLHYTGFTFLGAMLPSLAHTATCAWGLTTGGPRVSDAYRVPDTNEDAVLLNGIRSPILARQDGWAYAVCSPYTGRTAEFEAQLFQMLHSRDVTELRSAFDALAFPPQNVLAADSRGDAFYLRTGRVPRRPHGATGILSPDQLWEGFLRPDELVHIDNPTSGYLQNCNSAPDTVTPELDASHWHPDAFNDLAGRQTSRSERSIELLATARSVDVADVTAWAVEDAWPDTPRWLDGLRTAVLTEPARVAALSAERRELLDTLLGFDGHASPESRTASAWLAWRRHIAATDVPADELAALVAGFDADLLLDAVETCVIDYEPYGTSHLIAQGVPGRGGGFLSRPPASTDLRGVEEVPLRATYFKDGVAVGGGPALRIVRFGSDGMRSWSLLLPKQAEVFSRGGVLPTAFVPAEATFER